MWAASGSYPRPVGNTQSRDLQISPSRSASASIWYSPASPPGTGTDSITGQNAAIWARATEAERRTVIEAFGSNTSVTAVAMVGAHITDRLGEAWGRCCSATQHRVSQPRVELDLVGRNLGVRVGAARQRYAVRAETRQPARRVQPAVGDGPCWPEERPALLRLTIAFDSRAGADQQVPRAQPGRAAQGAPRRRWRRRRRRWRPAPLAGAAAGLLG